MAQKKIIEFGGQPSPILHPKLQRTRLFLDIFVIVLAILGFVLFVFVLIPSRVFLIVVVFCALYTYLARRYI